MRWSMPVTDGACLFLSTCHVRGKAAREDVSAGGEAIYFSPAAIAEVPHLIAVCGAEPSPPPDRGCATLLVGKETDWDLLPRGSSPRRAVMLWVHDRLPFALRSCRRREGESEQRLNLLKRVGLILGGQLAFAQERESGRGDRAQGGRR
jgi:hypothetical protein